MPANFLTPPWTDSEKEFLRTAGLPDALLTVALNKRFNTARSQTAVRQKRNELGVTPVTKRKPASVSSGVVEVTENDTEMVVRSNSATIRTVEDLLAHIDADLTKWDVAAVESTRNEQPSRNEEGDMVVTEYFRLHVRLKPKASTVTTEDAVRAIIDGAFAKRTPPSRPKGVVQRGNVLQMVGIFDPHIGKRSWGNETRQGNYDLPIAVKTLREANGDLILKGNARGVASRLIFVGGDFYNADTKAGTTTGGTPQDNDSRIPKMIEEGAKALFDIIEWSADFCPTKVVVVPGNHDATQSWALQLILQSYFRLDKRVSVDNGNTSRKYHQHGKCLLGVTHGDKAWKRLPGLMARESAYEWGQTTLRHIHHGHLHSKRQIDTVEGVTIFQHPALCHIDAWHAEEGYVSDRGQESYYYHSAGSLVGMDYYSPDMDMAVARGTK